METYDLIIVGIGPAGLTASIYASRYRLKNLVIGKQLGGELALAHKIENYPGIRAIKGTELAQKMGEQAEGLGAKILYEEVGRIENTKSEQPNQSGFLVETTGGQKFISPALIVAAGSERRRLGIPGEKELIGKGISYCTTCLPGEEEIVANSSMQKIGRIGITQNVLTIDGTFQDIEQIMAHDYNGEMVIIKNRFFTEPVRLTANHPVLSTTVRRDYYKKKLNLDIPEWKRADQLTRDDTLVYPIIRKTEDKQTIKFSETLGVKVVGKKARNNQETHSSLRFYDEIPLNRKFLRLAGYYLAEGCVTRHGVNFSFNKKEKEFINDVKTITEEIFSLNPYVKTEGGVTRVCIFSKLIRDLFHILFGKYAPNKKVPHWALLLPGEKQKEIIRGWYRGDGCLRDKDFCIVTTSRMLAYQMRDILLRLGAIPSIVKREKEKLNKTPGEIGGRKIRFNHDKYHITVGGPSLKKMSEILNVRHPKLNKRKYVCKHAWMDKQLLYLPIREIKRESYKGKVYNLAVKGNNTYIAKNFIVHNCDAPFYKDKTVGVVGGSDAAVTGAIHTAEFAKQVFLIYRGEELRAEPIWLEELKKLIEKGKVVVIYKTNVIKVLSKAQGLVGGVELDQSYQNSNRLALDGLFIEIGGVPGTALVKTIGVELTESGHVKVDETMKTNIPGLFCAGDMVDKSIVMQQAITAMAQGAIAAAGAYKFLKGSEAPRILGV